MLILEHYLIVSNRSMEIARNQNKKTLQEKLELACEGARQLLHLLEVVEDGGQARQLAQVGDDQR